jgi:hypothetical protein
MQAARSGGLLFLRARLLINSICRIAAAAAMIAAMFLPGGSPHVQE